MSANSERTMTIRTHRLRRRWADITRDALRALGLLAVVCLWTGVLLYGYLYVLSAPFFQIREVQVRGCGELMEKDVLALADLRPRQNLFAVNAKAVSSRVRRNPWVLSLVVGREWPNRLVLSIKERQAVALLRQAGLLHLVDREGTAFKPIAPDDNADLPVFTGFHRDREVDAEMLGKGLALLASLAKAEGLPGGDGIAEVHANRILGFSVYTEQGLCLHLGFDDYARKLQRLPPVLADLERRHLRQRFLAIDLHDLRKVTVERKDILPPVQITPAGKEVKT